ncbi:MAG TPA: hypothetical protein VFF13_05030 [archaeon]|nr:hypothetical protein [archaeon]
MASNIISSITAFNEKFVVPKDDRYNALEKYFARGGVISAVKSNGKWPKLVYPSPQRIEDQLKELQALKSVYESKSRDWSKKLSEAKNYHSKHQLLKFKDPLYWQHVAKKTMDSDYKADSEKVQIPVHLVADPRWKPMVKMFVNDLEYRKNLVETVENSIVYKDDKKVAKYADELQNFRSEMSTSKLDDIGKKLGKINQEISSLEAVKKWAKE